MSFMAAMVSIITVLGALFLSLRGLASYNVSTNRKIAMAVAWVAIIAVVAFVMGRISA